MGIFSVNVVAFAMIYPGLFQPRAYGGDDGADLRHVARQFVLVDGKMRSLFSILFGASMLLVIDRAEASGAVAGSRSITRAWRCCCCSACSISIWSGAATS